MESLEELREQVRALSEERDRLRELYDRAPDMMASVDPKSATIKDVNETTCAQLGYARRELVGQPIFFVYHPRCLPEVEHAFTLFAKTGHVPTTELQLKRKDGSIIDVSLKVSSVTNSDGEIVHSSSIWRDITAAKEAEAALKHLESENTELAKFAYVASHDLQEPLRTVVNFSKLLEEELKLDEDSQAALYLRFITEGATRMQELIAGLLEYARMGQERKLEAVDCNEVVGLIVQDLNAMIVDRSAKITIEELPTLNTDRVEVAQLFRNLMSNALKFHATDARPEVHISAVVDAHHVQLIVDDNGIGIPEAARERVFNMFRREHARSEFAGSGVGLALCRRIVELNNGELQIHASPLGGARFTVRLPKELHI